MSTGAYVGVDTTYTPVEYIESTGCQYINTGVNATNNTKIEIKVKWTYPLANECLFCARDFNSSYSVTNAFALFKIFNTNQFRWDFSTSGSNFSHTVNASTEYTYVGSKDGLYENGTLIRSGSSATFTSTALIHLLANHISGQSQNGVYFINHATVKLYYCKIYENNVLVRDFIPVITNDNLYGLYEQVEGKLYFSANKTPFTGGSTTGQSTAIGEIARKIKKMYVGVNGIAKRIIKGYVGVSGIAKIDYDKSTPQYDFSIGNKAQRKFPAVVGTQDYVLIAGGGEGGSENPMTTVTAYDKNGVATSAPDLTTRAWYATGSTLNGKAIISHGKSAYSGSSRTNQCLAYDNSLVKTTLSNVTQPGFDIASASNSTHMIVGCGCVYSSDSTTLDSYNTSFVKTTLTNSSCYRRGNFLARVGDYLVLCGSSNQTSGNNTDFYDNSNVKTTASNPWGKQNHYTLGLSTNSYAIFFGGASAGSLNNAYKDCKAYNSNKVVTSFNLPDVVSGAQGFSTGKYACVCYCAKSYIYNDNLVLVSTTSGDFNRGENSMAGISSTFAIVHEQDSSCSNFYDL